MRAVLQRVSRAAVRVDGEVIGEIGPGYVVLLGVAHGDTQADAEWMADKMAGLRVFADVDGKMNLSVVEAGGSVLLISQFTLLADTRKGRRPSFVAAAAPEEAIPLYEAVAAALRGAGIEVATGSFGAHMDVELTNDGPVTIIVDSADRQRPRSA